MTSEFTTVRTEGGLFPPDLLHRIAAGDDQLGGLGPDKYGLKDSDRVGEAASRAWARAKNYWAAFQSAIEGLSDRETGLTETRQQWLQPLLKELGYRDLQYDPAGELIGDRRYPRYYRAGAVPLHVLTLRQSLDRVLPAGAGQRRASPHALMQEYLNLSESTYGIISNGLQLRLLRDSASLTRQAYLEFDLQAIMDGGVYADFVLLFAVLHQSRLPQVGVEASQCWLEQWRSRAESQGTRALGKLREGVEDAIRALGNGFLSHPDNDELRAKLRSGTLTAPEYYRELLRLIYRMIFLFVAEERELLFPVEADPADKRRYGENYSLSRLRDVTRKYLADNRHDDLWRALRIGFQLLSGQKQGMSVPALGGGLFDEESCPHLDGCFLRNDVLADVVRRLSWVRVDRVTRRVNYREMDAEELGGVYEGLLELQPRMVADPLMPRFELVGSGERKLTGSYYTPTSLVQELIKSALEPVIADRLGGKKSQEQRREALLGITVCDPACGSGHFLLAAARRLADELARVEAGDAEPDPPQLRSALRQVISRCVYGVDMNPLAVDLCKLALWMEGHDPGRPVTFLDAHIKVGNSLVGASSELLRAGIPDGAYDPVTGDDKKIATGFKKLNKKERNWYSLVAENSDAWGQLRGQLVASVLEIDGLPEEDAVQLAGQRDRYRRYRNEVLEPMLLPLDAWTAAFFWPLSPGQPEPPTNGVLDQLSPGNPEALTRRQRELVATLRDRHSFFHWELEFPAVFERRGFDCVLGNPPWERIKLQEEEFFAGRDPEIATAPNKAARQRLIDALQKTDPVLNEAFHEAKRAAEAQSKFVRESGRFGLTAIGDVNLYALFAEQDRSLVNGHGRAGVIVPTGIATDDSTKKFFGDLAAHRALAGLFDFENRDAIFPSVHRSYKFCLLTMAGGPVPAGDFAFFLASTDHLRDGRRRFRLAAEDFALLNPNTRTCPIFRTKEDAELTRAIYRRVPVLVNEATGENPWGFQVRRVFDMNKTEVLELCRRPEDACGLSRVVRMFESKLVHQYNHRWATYRATVPKDATLNELQDPKWSIRTRYMLSEDDVWSRLRGKWDKRWLIAYRDIARATDERTMIASIIPFGGTDFTLRVALPRLHSPRWATCLLSNLNTMVFDYIARQMVGGTHISDYLTEQLPVLPPSAYTSNDLSFIDARVLKLTYSAHDLKAFAEDLGYDGPPFLWDEERRAVLRAELDAYFAALYGLDRDELRYILDPADVYGSDFPSETFRVLKEKEIKAYGEYRTGRLVLEAWDRLGLTPRNREGRYSAS